jgi:hypothetical protein
MWHYHKLAWEMAWWAKKHINSSIGCNIIHMLWSWKNLDMYKLTYSIDMSMDLFKIDLNVIQLEKEREWLVDLDLPLGTSMKIVSLIT